MGTSFWAKALSVITILSVVSACGGGGDESKPAQVFDISQLASQKVIIEEVNCLPQIPTWNTFNNFIYDQAQLPPLARTYLTLSEHVGEGGATVVEIPLIDQNQGMLDVMSDLITNVKDFGSKEMGQRVYDGFYPYTSMDDKPAMIYAPNKESYQQIRTRCRSVDCVGESVFGNTWGARFYFKERFGLSISGQVTPKGEEFRDEQSVRAVLLAISSLPESTFPIAPEIFTWGYEVFSNNIVITPYTTGETMSQGAAAVMASYRTGDGQVINADIMMFDAWKDVASPFDKALTVFHELIHLLDITTEQRTTFSSTKDWLSFSNWIYDEAANQWFADNKFMCSAYGRTNPAEDFAECGVLYRYAPQVLKQISMKKYNFYKNKVFQGVEYTTAQSCSRSSVKFF